MENIITKSCKQFGTVRQIKESPMLWCGSDVAKALGYARPNDAISVHCRCTVKRRIPHPQSKNKQIEMAFIPEADVYRLICHSKLPKAQEFEKWVFEDVVPQAVRGEKPPEPAHRACEYFDKTYKGEPVLSVSDIAEIAKIDSNTVRYTLGKRLTYGEDYRLLTDGELSEFKLENPRFSKGVNSLYIVTRSGFEKLCRIFGITLEKSGLFLDSSEPSAPSVFITAHTKYCMAEIRREAERLINLTYLLDDAEGVLLGGDTYKQCKAAIVRQMKAIGSCVAFTIK